MTPKFEFVGTVQFWLTGARADELAPERHVGQQRSARSGAADGERLSASAARGRVRGILIGAAGTGHHWGSIRKMSALSPEKGVTASQWVREGRPRGPLPLEVSQPQVSAGLASQP